MSSIENRVFEIVQNFTAKDSEQLLSQIHLLSFQDQNSFNSFNIQLEKCSRKVYCKMMEQSKYDDLAVLLETFFNSLKMNEIKISIIISLMDNILECVGVSDLQKILKTFSQNIGNCQGLADIDQNKLLKIINHLLKRVSKAQDYYLRGQLQITLTTILPLCHQSGFHRRGNVAKPSQVEEQNELYNQMGNQGGISYQFFQQFWSLQKYLMDPNELNNDQRQKVNQVVNQNSKISLLQIKKIKSIVMDLIDYFERNQIKEILKIENQPIKFLKIFNLLPLQLNDFHFRCVILIQIFIFCFSLKNPASIKNAFVLREQQKLLIDDIEKNTIQTLKKQTKNTQFYTLYQNLSQFLKTQLYWVDLKDNWKQQKKIFFRNNIFQSQHQEKRIIEQKKKQTQLFKLLHKVRKQIDQKMSIDGSNLKKFLQNKIISQLSKEPSIPSFSYYFKQALDSIESFDYDTGTLTEFQTRSSYNMFEWKAMRSLYRENVKDMTISDKAASKIKQYRMLNLIYQKEEQLLDQPRKKKKIQNAE